MSRLLAALVALPFLVGGVAAASGRDAEVVLTFTDPQVVESSGLVAWGGLVHTVNDSGDTGRVFIVGPDGATVGVTTWASQPVDVEALAPAGPGEVRVGGVRVGEVWVGDIGDNGASRASIQVARVPVGAGERVATGSPRFELVYADGPRDAETLLVDPADGRLLVVSKGFFGGTLYRAPRRLDPDAPNVLEPIADTLAVATDGAFWPDGRHLVVRSYTRAIVHAWPSMRVVGEIDLPDQDQGEGIAVTPDGRVLVSTEGQFTDVLEVPLPRDVRQAVAPEREPPPSGGDQGSRPQPAPMPIVEEGGPLPSWLLLGGGAGVVALLGLLTWAVRRR